MKRSPLLLGLLGAAAIGALAAQAQVPGVNSTLNSVFTLVYDASTMKKTYSASRGFYSTAATAQDICTLYGRAGQTVKVRRIIIGLRSSSAGSDPVGIIKRSSIQIGGTAQTVTPVAYDSASAASTAVAEFYTANATTAGTFVGLLAEITVPVAPTSQVDRDYTYITGQLGSPIVLRGAAESVSANLSGITLTAGAASCTFEWTEDNDS